MENKRKDIEQRVFLGGAVAIIIVYAFFSFLNIYTKLVVDILLFVFNLLAAYYIASQIAIKSWRKNSLMSQKKIASTAIRHLRQNLKNLKQAIRRIDQINSALDKDGSAAQYLTEIRNYIQLILNGVHGSQFDFEEIVEEELQKEAEIEEEIPDLIHELNIVQEKLKMERQDHEHTKELNKRLTMINNKLNYKMHLLPFGPTGPSGEPIGSADRANNEPRPESFLPGPEGPQGH